jgi:hypothetical protein
MQIYFRLRGAKADLVPAVGTTAADVAAIELTRQHAPVRPAE